MTVPALLFKPFLIFQQDIAPEEAERDWTYLPATILRQFMKNVREDEESLNLVSEELDFELDSTKKRELFEEREIYK